MSTRTLLMALIIVTLVLIGAFGGAWWYIQNIALLSDTNSSAAEMEPTPYQTLIQSNDTFAQAEMAMNEGTYGEAEQLYTQSLQKVTDPNARDQIRFKIALAVDRGGDVMRAITLYKDIAKDATNKYAAAYSVMSLGEIIHRTSDPAIRAAVFSGVPYASMVVPGDNDLTDRHLEEYASSFYPLGLSEVRIALWYTKTLVNHVSQTGTLPPNAQEYMDIIRTHIENAEADVARTINDSNASYLIAYVRQWEAVIFGSLAGIRQTSVAKADAAYRRAFGTFAAHGNTDGEDGFLRYSYAFYLSGFGRAAENVAKIKAALSPIYENPVYKNSRAHAFFAAEKDDQLGQKDRLQELASIDPKFKQLLVSLGWNEKDFSSTKES